MNEALLHRIQLRAAQICGVLFLVTVAPLLADWLQSDVQSFPFLVKLLLFPVMIAILILSFICVWYLKLVFAFLPFLDTGDYLSTVPVHVAEPHAVFWFLMLLLTGVPVFIRFLLRVKAALTARFQQEPDEFGFDDEFGPDMPRSPSARRKEVRRASMAAELEETLADIKSMEERIKAREEGD
ncbi:hypothetical protein [Parasphingopyxis sp.]|uniref:hypothetical protein n=1 Tax=Parasphingopyxis sp. TaxID=1920299 RepID=UPI0026178B81|nr:hypothetical protein [Parasphingopyxis sp.]